MKRGELYLVSMASKNDVKKQSCAPVYTSFEGLSTQVEVSLDEGLKHASAIRCDELISIRKSYLPTPAHTY